MNPDIEKILLAQASREAEQAPQLSEAAALGALGGAGLGVAGGHVLQPIGKAIGNLRGTNGVFKPGGRIAGGLVGAILGGGLGAVMQQQAINEPSGAGRLLAKIQAQGGVMPEDKEALEYQLRNAYTQQGLLG